MKSAPRRAGRWLALVVCAGLGCAPLVAAQSDQDLLTATEPYRVALHHEPSLAVPLQRLVETYRNAGAGERLLALYRQHVATYPHDASARAVLVRLLRAFGDASAREVLAAGIAATPQDAYLRVLEAEQLAAAGDPRAAEAWLAAAERSVGHQRNERLAAALRLAARGGRDDLIERALTVWQSGVAAPEAAIGLAEDLLTAGRGDIAARVLAGLGELPPAVAIEVELLRANIDAAADRRAEAAARIDALLARLAPGHWQRAEIFRQRLQLVADEAEAQRLIDGLRAARDADPTSEQAWLDLAAAERALADRSAALATLRAASEALPASAAIEQRLLDAYRAARDLAGLDEWLAARIAADPSRLDLIEQRVLLLWILRRDEQAEDLLDTLLADLDQATATQRLLHMARRLRPLQLHAAAADLLRRVVAAEPQRYDLRREYLEVVVERDPHALSAELVDLEPAGEDAGVADALDLARWLAGEDQVAAAYRLLSQLPEHHPHHPELLALQAELAWRIGRDDEAAALRARLQADIRSVADYRRWLQLRVATTPERERRRWLFSELDRQRPDLEPATAAAQRAAVARELMGDLVGRDQLADRLSALVAAQPEGDGRAILREALVDVLDGLRDRRAELAEQLELLAAERPQQRGELLARAALAGLPAPDYLGGDDEPAELPDLDPASWDLGAIQDFSLLARLLRAVRESGSPDDQARLFRRMLELEEDNDRLWEAWLEFLIVQRREAAFRMEARRLLGRERQLAPSVRAQLEAAILGSLWREIGRGLADGESLSLLGLLEEAERLAVGEQLRWTWWTRAVLLHRAGRREAAAELVAQLRAEAEAAAADGAGAAIVFPDGLRIDLAHALDLLGDEPESRAGGGADPALPPYQLAWRSAFAEPVHAALGCGETVIVQTPSGLSGLAASDGRVRWQLPVQSASRHPRPLVRAGPERVAWLDGRQLRCIDAGGSERWRAPVAEVRALAAGADLVVVLSADGTAIGIDASTGRRRWVAARPGAEGDHDESTPAGSGPIFAPNPSIHHPARYRSGDAADQGAAWGLAVGGGQVLIGHNGARLLRLADGAELWRFPASGQRALPLPLDERWLRFVERRPLRRASWAGDDPLLAERFFGRMHLLSPTQMQFVEAGDRGAELAIAGDRLLIGRGEQTVAVDRALPFLPIERLPGRPLPGAERAVVTLSDQQLHRLDPGGEPISVERARLQAAGDRLLLALDAEHLVLRELERLAVVAHAPVPAAVGEALADHERARAREQAERQRRSRDQEYAWQISELEMEITQLRQALPHTSGQQRQQLLHYLQDLERQLARMRGQQSPEVTPRLLFDPTHPLCYVQVGGHLLALRGQER